MGDRYVGHPDGGWQCNDCTSAWLARCAGVSPGAEPAPPAEVFVLDRDAHDRWHVERGAAADPAQQRML